MDLVSVITPAYNAEKYLSDAIESVICQDYYNWEMIIVDDCSKDDTRLISEKYMKKDERIKLISLKENGGVANARNIAMGVANGRYIAFLDSDDMWRSNKLSKQVEFMKKNNYYFTFSSYEWIDDNGNKLNKVIKVPPKADYKRMLKGNPIGCLTAVIDKKNVRDIKMPNAGHEDYIAWLNIIKGGVTAYGLNESLAMYRKADNSLSSNKFKAVAWTWNIYRRHEELSFLKSVKCLGSYITNTALKYLAL